MEEARAKAATPSLSSVRLTGLAAEGNAVNVAEVEAIVLVAAGISLVSLGASLGRSG